MQIIREFLERHHIKDKIFALGVSGGADSMALALMFKREFPDYRLVALTVDHGLRPSSLAEAQYVAKVMRQFGIEHHILTWSGEKPQTGIEEQARTARYHLLFDWCKEHGIDNLAVAHHLYDQAETFLMRLQRGSGLYGLAAMEEVSIRDGIRVLRPFLNIAPTELKGFLKSINISWVEDESNQCIDFLRVRMRRFLSVLEKETGISPARLGLAAANLGKVKNFITATVDETIRNKVHFWGKSGASVDYAEFLSWHTELKFYILGKLIFELGDKEYAPQAEKILNLSQVLENNGHNSLTLGGCIFIREGLRLFIIKEDRENSFCYKDSDWNEFLAANPEARGIKIPYKLKALLIAENLSKKK